MGKRKYTKLSSESSDGSVDDVSNSGSDIIRSDSGSEGDDDSVDSDTVNDSDSAIDDQVEEQAMKHAPSSTDTRMAAKKPRDAGDLPTKDEQLQLHNTEALMRTNLLKLQIDEMLSEVSCKKDFERKKLTSWVQACLSAVEEGGTALAGTKLSRKWLRKQDPSLQGILDTVGTAKDSPTALLDFVAPDATSVVGSAALDTGTAPFVNVDVSVSMPAAMFEAKDLLNYGYFYKRALWLAGLASSLAGRVDLKERGFSVQLFKGDPRKPVVLLQPAIKGRPVTVRLIPTLSSAAFNLTQLLPSKNNVRPASWLRQKVKTNVGGDALAPTPRYNNAVLEDVAMQTQATFLKQSLEACAVAKDATVLLKVWLTQRGERFALGGLDSHSATLLVAYLVQTRRITRQMTIVGAFTLVLKMLADRDLTRQAMDFTQSSVERTEGTSALQLMFPLFDQSASGKERQFLYNCLWRVSGSSLSMIQEEAVTSLQLVQGQSSDSAFSSLFLQKRNFFDRHDVFFHISFAADSLVRASMENNGDDGAHADLQNERAAELDLAVCDFTAWEYASTRVVEVATRALGNRALAVRAIANVGSSSNRNGRTIFGVAADDQKDCIVTLGVQLAPDACHRRVDRGPSADDEDAASEFRRFWGSGKSQLRRFQDGSIIEAVLWEEHLQRPGYVPRGERISEEILRYILARHLPAVCGPNAENLEARTTQLEHHALPATSASGHSLFADADALARKAIDSLDRLRMALISSLKEHLPLNVVHVTGLDAALRYTAHCPPVPHPILLGTALQTHAGRQLSLLCSPLCVQAEVEGGGKWPKDPQAIKQLKLAFLLRVHDVLFTKMGVRSVARDDCLDVIQDGFVFRVSFVSDMEIERRLVPSPEPEIDAKLAKLAYPRDVLERNIVYPAHCNAIKAVAARFPSFASSLRLLSSWLDGHYFSGCLPLEALELIVTSVYTNPDVGRSPTSPSTGFRAALRLLANFDWESQPLVVDATGELTAADRLDLQEKFESARQRRQSEVLYIVSLADKQAGLKPMLAFETVDKACARLVVATAQQSLLTLTSWLEDPHGETDSLVDEIMNGSEIIDRCNVTLQIADALINAKAVKTSIGNDWFEQIQRGAGYARLKVFANMSNAEVSVDNLVLIKGDTANPIQEEVVSKLRVGFGDIALFFWNAQSATEIGVLWKPAAFLPKKFAILESRNKLALTSADASIASITVMNVTEILAQMTACSEGAISTMNFL